jgi:hypothetical protein
MMIALATVRMTTERVVVIQEVTLVEILEVTLGVIKTDHLVMRLIKVEETDHLVTMISISQRVDESDLEMRWVKAEDLMSGRPGMIKVEVAVMEWIVLEAVVATDPEWFPVPWPPMSTLVITVAMIGMGVTDIAPANIVTEIEEETTIGDLVVHSGLARRTTRDQVVPFDQIHHTDPGTTKGETQLKGRIIRRTNRGICLAFWETMRGRDHRRLHYEL